MSLPAGFALNVLSDGWLQLTWGRVGQARYPPCARDSAEHFAVCLAQKFPTFTPRGEGAAYVAPDSSLIERKGGRGSD
jgi:hypothetical protein